MKCPRCNAEMLEIKTDKGEIVAYDCPEENCGNWINPALQEIFTGVVFDKKGGKHESKSDSKLR